MHPFKKRLKKLIPPQYHFKLVSLKHKFTKFKNSYYSQNGEDVILISLFPKDYSGFYVDVGAHHPYRISNTYFLHKRGWNGINIDANPQTINLFNKARPHDTNILTGVGKERTAATYHQFADPAVNTFSETDAEHWKNKKWNKYLGSTKIKIQRLEDILSENLNSKEQVIDLLNIDVEGLDLEVLESNNWEKFKPRVVIVEALDFKLEQMSEHPIYNFLHSKGYILSDKVKFSLIFVSDING